MKYTLIILILFLSFFQTPCFSGGRSKISGSSNGTDIYSRPTILRVGIDTTGKYVLLYGGKKVYIKKSDTPISDPNGKGNYYLLPDNTKAWLHSFTSKSDVKSSNPKNTKLLKTSSTEIHDAARDGNMQKLVALAEANPDSLYTFCTMGKTPLHWATGKGHPEIVIVLLDRFKMPADTRNANQGTSLHVAASQAQSECAEILIAHGADLNAKAKDGATPLHFACFKGKKQGHIEIIKLLLEKGCNPNSQMKNGVTPMNIAAKRNNNEVIEILKTFGGKPGKIDGNVKLGRYDFKGGTAYKTNSNNINRPNSQTSSNFSSKNTNMNNSAKGSMNISFSQRKKMMLQRFDANDDGILDDSERLKAREFMKNRMKSRIMNK